MQILMTDTMWQKKILKKCS